MLTLQDVTTQELLSHIFEGIASTPEGMRLLLREMYSHAELRAAEVATEREAEDWRRVCEDLTPGFEPRSTAASKYALEALYSALNVEGSALAGTSFAAWKGLDVPSHFVKIRAAIGAMEDCGFTAD